jgi:hypothetical protein
MGKLGVEREVVDKELADEGYERYDIIVILLPATGTIVVYSI